MADYDVYVLHGCARAACELTDSPLFHHHPPLPHLHMYVQILFGLPLWAGCLITFFDTLTYVPINSTRTHKPPNPSPSMPLYMTHTHRFLGIHYWGVRKLESLFVLLVATMTVCFLCVPP